jgi:predicted house-cleaning noncanonical NTP pyrophosphatase (MazG superfamily)
MIRKLVRDNIPEIVMRKTGVQPECVIADNKDYGQALLDKLVEEAREFADNPCQEELADVREVLDALAVFHQRIGEEKRREKGAFNRRIIMTMPDEVQ